MALNFPDNPVDGDQIAEGNSTWIYNASKTVWNLLEGILNVEKVQLIGTASNIYNVDVVSNQIVFVTGNATSDWTINIRASESGTFNNAIAIGETITIVFIAKQGSSIGYYNNIFQIDNVTQTVLWIDGDGPTSGTVNGIDSYSFSIIKTNANTYTVLGSVAPFLT